MVIDVPRPIGTPRKEAPSLGRVEKLHGGDL